MTKKYLLVDDCYSGKIVIVCKSNNNNYEINAFERYSDKKEKNIFSKHTHDKDKANHYFKEAIEVCRKKAIKNMHNGCSNVIFGKKWIIKNKFDYDYACKTIYNNITCCVHCDDFMVWKKEDEEIKRQSADIERQAKELGII